MAKISAWLFTVIGVLFVTYLLGLTASPVGTGWEGWAVGLAFLVVGLTKLARNYGMMKKK